MGVNIAIDGPAGAGKSTIARLVARKLNFDYIDTGAMYRTMGLYLDRNQISFSNEAAVKTACEQAEIGVTYENGEQQMWLDGENVSDQIRNEKAAGLASACGKLMPVREKLVDFQQKLALSRNIVMDGRDICTVVLPRADVKVYLTASVEERAKRRFLEYQKKGMTCTFEEVKQEVEERDYNDMHRAISPLCRAEDAVLVDTSDMSIEEAAEAIMKLLPEK